MANPSIATLLRLSVALGVGLPVLVDTHEEFDRLDDQIDARARSLPGVIRLKTWHAPPGVVVNAMYYLQDEASVAQLARFPEHREARGQVHRSSDGYQIVVSMMTAAYGDARLGP